MKKSVTITNMYIETSCNMTYVFVYWPLDFHDMRTIICFRAQFFQFLFETHLKSLYFLALVRVHLVYLVGLVSQLCQQRAIGP